MRLGSSFRDPSGFVYEQDGVLLRQVNPVYEDDFRVLKTCGLLEELEQSKLIVATEPADLSQALTPEAVAVLKPERIPFISHPYEWCFSQLKDAALLTLDIAERALAKGMVLKDATAFNIQFVGAKPLLIDSLSFERYEEGQPWIAYRQFCQHFLAPLAIMSSVDARLGTLSRQHIDGIPLDLASRMLPKNTKWKPGLLTHIHMHARAGLGEGDGAKARTAKVSNTALRALLANLRSVVAGLSWKPEGTVWGDYYDNTNYDQASMNRKRELVADFIPAPGSRQEICWDLGANTGEFSSLAEAKGYYTVAWDVDVAAVEKAYCATRGSERRVLPLLQDLANPSPSIGWASQERDSLVERGPASLVLALALVHHLAIANNVPLPRIAEFFARIGDHLVIEFVPKDDSQVVRMLSSRRDIFSDYSVEGFEAAFEKSFKIERKVAIEGTRRTLYKMRRQA